MCGLFGYVLKRPIPGLGKLLATRNDKRGGHSWGYCSLAADIPPSLHKGDGKFLNDKKSVYGYLPDFYRTVIGHTRYATTGKVCVDNAHPFNIGDIWGAHNGQVYNHRELSTKYKREFEVDSMHLFAHLNEGMNFDEFEGYGSISWYDTRDERIRLCKMNRGDLSIRKLVKNKEDLGVVWSSLDSDLVEVLRHLNLSKEECFDYKIVEGQVYFAQEDGLFLEVLPTEDDKTVGRSLKFGKSWPNYSSGYGYGNSYHSGTGGGSSYSGYSEYSKSRHWDSKGSSDDKSTTVSSSSSSSSSASITPPTKKARPRRDSPSSPYADGWEQVWGGGSKDDDENVIDMNKTMDMTLPALEAKLMAGGEDLTEEEEKLLLEHWAMIDDGSPVSQSNNEDEEEEISVRQLKSSSLANAETDEDLEWWEQQEEKYEKWLSMRAGQ